MPKRERKKGKYPFLKMGYTSFPLRDVGKKFEVVDTVDIDIKKPIFIDFKKSYGYLQLHMNQREIEKAVWKEIRKEYKKLFKKADWLVISMISDFGNKKLMVSLDMLKEV